MKIKHISCTQFAGVRDREISFEDGINVICGKNESGKSTMVNLIARTLFQKAKIDRRSDKEFCELYFPGVRKGSNITGDFVDGRIKFETEHGTYTLSKEWGADSRCALSTPEGIVRDGEKIDALLKEALHYGEGVYSEFLFSSQHNAGTALQTLLDASKKTTAKAEITDAVSQAFAESDGISVDTIEQAIQAKIDGIAGKHWDSLRNVPVRKTGGGRWSTGLGDVLKAYYAWEDAELVLEEISRLENEVDRAAGEYAEKDRAARSAEAEYRKFHEFSSSLIMQNERRKLIESRQKERDRIGAVLADWPVLEQTLALAKKLQKEKADRDLLNQYESARKIVDKIHDLEGSVQQCLCPESEEIMRVKKAQRAVDTLENKLCGMNLTADIRMLGDHAVMVTSLRTGDSVDISGGVANISEAVKIVIPGVMEMQLSPADVSVSAIEKEIHENREVISEIFTKYSANTAEELESLKKTIAEAKTELDTKNRELALVLGATTYEALEAAAAEICEDLRAESEIKKDIMALCGNADLSKLVTAKETVIDGYISEYGNMDQLKVKAFDLNAELEKAKNSVSVVDNIPAEYAAISNPEAHLAFLQGEQKQKQDLREKALTDKTAAESRLETYKENLQGDPEAEAGEALRRLSEQKSLLSDWMHIEAVFKAQKENIHGSPMQDIAESFSRYLGVISGGRVSTEFPDAEKLAMQVYSDDRLLDYGKLSEGTKETVSLAFRLAVLDHLFPDGGVIVLDDPFADMDPERTEQGCRLLRECAKRHQIIFLTCHEEYPEMLKGCRIDL